MGNAKQLLNQTVAKAAAPTSNRLTPMNDAAIAAQNGYNKANYQNGWGIGNGANISLGFNQFNDANAVRNEMNRVNTVMQNRTQFGLQNTPYDSYYTKLQSAYQPFQDAEDKATAAQQAYQQQQQQNKTSYQDQFNQFNDKIQGAVDSYKSGPGYTGYLDSMNQTIDGIAAKYGFSFSRDTARQQAEAEAQALRDANADAQRRNASQKQENLASIDANLMNMAEGLDRSYFQQMMQQQQNQVNSGLNGGIAADQDLRLQMARQAEMGSAYRDANLGIMQENNRFTNDDLRLAEALGTINQQALARENSLWEEQQKYLYDVLGQDRNYYLNAANMEWGQSQDLANLYLGQQDRLTSNYQWQTGFDYGSMRDAVADSQFDKNYFLDQQQLSNANQQWRDTFDYQQARDLIGDSQWNQQFNWGKLMDEAGLTGNYNGQRTLQGQQFDWGKLMDEANLTGNYNGGRTLQGQEFDWGKLVDEAGLTGMYNGGKTWDRQMDEFDMNMAQQQLALSRARASSGGGGGSSSSTAKATTSKTNLSNSYSQYQTAKYNTPGNATDAYYMNQLKKVPANMLEEYNRIKTLPAGSVKTSNEKLNESLIDGVLAPSTTTNLQKYLNTLNNLNR